MSNPPNSPNLRNLVRRKLYVSSLGLGDFVAFLDDQDSSSCRQSADQIEAPSQLRKPIMHRIETGRFFRVRIEARRATVFTTSFLANDQEVFIQPPPQRPA